MPVKTISSVLGSLLNVTAIHRFGSFFIGKGFTMGIARAFPLTIWIKCVNGNYHEEQWVFLPHLLSSHKSMVTKPSVN